MNRLALSAFFALSLAACTDPPSQSTPTSSAAVALSAAPATDGAEADGGAADASDDADPSDAAKPWPAPSRVRTLEIPDETNSALPKVPEWTDVMRRDVVVRPEFTCEIQRVREWNRINCNTTNSTVTLVAGTRTGVSVWAGPESAQILFPVRRGDRRVIELFPHDKQVFDQNGGYGGPTIVQGGGPVVFSETWLEGEDAPTLVVQ